MNFLKHQLPQSIPLNTTLFKLFALSSLEKKEREREREKEKRDVLGLLCDLCLHRDIRLDFGNSDSDADRQQLAAILCSVLL